jgi:RNA polymerase sigma-70 factor (ECF subfamily)
MRNGDHTDERDHRATLFETHRGALTAMAYRMLGSLAEAEDAVQESWIRLSRSDVHAIDNLSAWLRTVVSHVCLDMLRARASRREDPEGLQSPDIGQTPDAGIDPEQEAALAESVGRALLVVLNRLAPVERIAFVLHDMFAVPFDEIAPIVARSAVATKKLASRARRKVRGTPAIHGTELARHRRVVERFLAASRAGDIAAILMLLAPDVVRRADATALAPGRPREVRGARTVAGEITVFGQHAGFAQVALVNGAVGVVVAPRGRLRSVLIITIEGDIISSYEIVSDPHRLRSLSLAVFDE